MNDIDIAVLVGSLRKDSINLGLARILAEEAPAGVEVSIIEGLADVPFYDEDIDAEGIGAEAAPSAAVALRERVTAADRVIAVTPEYNGTMPAVLNNAIDWLSRPYGTGAIVGKPFAVVGATPTPYGGKWAHEDAARSAGIAGALVVEDAIVSLPAEEIDVLTDPAARDSLRSALTRLIAAEPVAAGV